MPTHSLQLEDFKILQYFAKKCVYFLSTILATDFVFFAFSS
ncbi:hypothetical protein CRENPOLYSF2_2550003 [Crenothrix polyspora]|uniref:Uncharacterized protein n=1 Tax=Crenothrix polyspora TaxID=360316 RepID=A0A1R4H764_9GAMM|nr:hypothetical protein CRENPOLYSF2_2550003 [Crenothrix polyspora]